MKRAVVIVVAGLLVGIPAVIYGPRAYRHFMAERLRKAAEKSLIAGHYDEAGRFYHLAMKRDVNDLALLRSYGDFLDDFNQPEALAVRMRIVQLDPKDDTARLNAAETALKYRRMNVARQMLVAPTAGMQAMPRYHDLQGWLQYLSQDFQNADETWSKALATNPGNKIYAANLATVRLDSINPQIRDEAREKLEGLLAGEKPPLSAAASLMTFYARSPSEPARLEEMLDRAQAVVPPANLFYTNYLDALHRWRPDRFREALVAYEKTAAAIPETAMIAQNWMIAARLYEELLQFRATLPMALRENIQSRLFEAEALFNLGRIDELNALLAGQEWTAMRPLKLAWQERLRRRPLKQDEGEKQTALNKWTVVLNEAGKNDAALNLLAKMTLDWGWGPEYALTQWAIVDAVPAGAQDALDTLSHYYERVRDARGLRRVLAGQLALQPDNPNLQNNFAFLSFLLGMDEAKAMKMSAALCAKYPGVPVYVSTRAFGLLKEGKAGEGLALFDGMDVAKWKGTPLGVGYGYLLAANADPRALDFLEGAERWVGFPEEIEMVAISREKAKASSSH